MRLIKCECGCGSSLEQEDSRGRKRRYKLGHGNRVKETSEKFWNKVDKSRDCWLWTAAVDNSGYGVFDWKIEPKAHRMSWRLAFGDIPVGMRVLHKCDIRHCVNPDHLFLGTSQDNSSDMVRKGRSAKGERHPRAKFTDSDIVAIRSLHESGYSYSWLASEFHVSKFAIASIIRRQTWKHV